MAHFQPAYASYPPPPTMILNNTPTPIGGYVYPQHPSMQYYPSVQPMAMPQPNGYYYDGYTRQHHGCTECCLGLLCLGACTCCCAECCGGIDDYCCSAGGDDCCGAC